MYSTQEVSSQAERAMIIVCVIRLKWQINFLNKSDFNTSGNNIIPTGIPEFPFLHKSTLMGCYY